MIDLARDIIATQPILALFLAIGVGYLVGQINLGGFSLGVGAVLFVGLAIGAFAPKASIVGPIGLTGLIMFLYGIGVLYGRQFFEGMAGAAGSMTSTATLQAALDTMKNTEPSIGYSVAYPFGVIGPILCLYFMTRHVKPKFPPKAQRFHMGEITLGAIGAGRTLDDITKDLPEGVQVTMIRKGQQNIVPAGAVDLAPGDGLMVIGDRKEAVDEAAAKFGRLDPGRIVQDRSSLDYIRVFVGKASAVGVPLSQLQMP